MALTITFNDANHTQVEYIHALEGPEYFDNANRRSLRFELKKDEISLDTLNALLTQENCKTLTLHNDGQPTEDNDQTTDPVTSVYENYSIKGKCSCEPVVVGHDEDTNAEIKEDRIIFVLYRKTPTEIEQELQAAQIAELQEMMAQLMSAK